MIVRRLGPGDESVVNRLATRDRPARAEELLADPKTIFVVVFEGDEPIGFVLGYELVRRHGDPSLLFVYEIDVDEGRQRRGVGTALMRELDRFARAQKIRGGFVLTNESNESAMAFYRSLGGARRNGDDVMWEFDYAGDSP
jgi:ribosomal protein S18 acetylase RimI-like enzyme